MSWISVCPPPRSSGGDDLHSRIKVESESISREQHKRENVPLTPLSGRPDRLSWSSNAVVMTRILGPSFLTGHRASRPVSPPVLTVRACVHVTGALLPVCSFGGPVRMDTLSPRRGLAQRGRRARVGARGVLGRVGVRVVTPTPRAGPYPAGAKCGRVISAPGSRRA